MAIADNVSRETHEHLRHYVEVLIKWNRKINLIGKSTEDDVWQRHIADSLAVAASTTKQKGTWLDLGSGAGLPGVVAAITNPSRRVALVEADQRKATFLRTVRRELDLNLEVFACRIEALQSPPVATITARALAPLQSLLELSHRFSSEQTELIFPKGTNWEQEHLAASMGWSYSLDVRQAPGPGRILRISDLRKKK